MVHRLDDGAAIAAAHIADHAIDVEQQDGARIQRCRVGSACKIAVCPITP
jgi:hypothetical protein